MVLMQVSAVHALAYFKYVNLSKDTLVIYLCKIAKVENIKIKICCNFSGSKGSMRIWCFGLMDR